MNVFDNIVEFRNNRQTKEPSQLKNAEFSNKFDKLKERTVCTTYELLHMQWNLSWETIAMKWLLERPQILASSQISV